MVKDVSINPASIHQHDVSVDANKPILLDASVEQSQELNQEVSIQYDVGNNEVSIQMDRPSVHNVSIQQVPVYTD